MAACSCIKGRDGYDINVEVIDPYTISYTDYSVWVDEPPYIIPDRMLVNITFPSGGDQDIYVSPKRNAIIRSTDLGLGKFQDGIYTFKLDPLSDKSGACGIERGKCFALLPNIKCCVLKAFADIDPDDDKYESLQDVDRWIKMSENSAELGKSSDSREQYKIAKKKLDKINCNCSGC